MLSPQERQDYVTFVAGHPLPVFYQDWWLDAVCGAENWSCVFARDKNDTLAAIWPFYLKKRFGGLFTTVDKPPLSLFCGPYISTAAIHANPAKALSRYHRLFRALIGQIPQHYLSRAYLPYNMSNAMPAVKQGWFSRTHHSYRLRSDHDSPQEIWGRLDGKVRTDLRQYAANEKHCIPLTVGKALLTLQQQSLDYRSSKVDFPTQQLERLYTAAEANNQAIGWMFRNEQGVPIAAVWLPYDQQSAYLMIAASDPEQRSDQNAVSHLIWRAINWCCSQKLIFDFEGSSLSGVEEYYRSWGPEVVTYHGISSRRWW